MNYRRLIIYSMLSFIVSLTLTYVVMKKVMGAQGSHMQGSYGNYIKEHVEVGVSLRNDWPEKFRKEAKAKRVPIDQALINYAVVDPTGTYIYYTKMAPKPTTFSDSIYNYVLYRCTLDGKNNKKIIDLGHIEYQSTYLPNPILFGDRGLAKGKLLEDGRIYVLRHIEDTDDDGRVTYSDNTSIWSCRFDGAAGTEKKIVELESGYSMVRVSKDERFISVSTRGEGPVIGSYIVQTATSEVIAFPDSYEIAFSLYGGQHFILNKTDENGHKKFFWYYLKKKELFEILIDPEFLKEGTVSLMHVKDVRSKILYLQKVNMTTDGPISTVYAVDLGVQPKRGETLQPQELTPQDVSSRFFTSSMNKFVFYRHGSGVDAGLSIIPPSGNPDESEKLFTFGKYVTSVRFSDSFEHLVYVKGFDSDGDGIVVPRSDLSEIYLVTVKREK